ncbi:MAG: hypothetical protein M3O22_05135 [Pseudomonadota bacterium]|nr:hypothetical protein [Pseudomonadota bacterium]
MLLRFLVAAASVFFSFSAHAWELTKLDLPPMKWADIYHIADDGSALTGMFFPAARSFYWSRETGVVLDASDVMTPDGKTLLQIEGANNQPARLVALDPRTGEKKSWPLPYTKDSLSLPSVSPFFFSRGAVLRHTIFNDNSEDGISSEHCLVWTPQRGVTEIRKEGIRRLFCAGISGNGTAVVGSYLNTEENSSGSFYWSESRGFVPFESRFDLPEISGNGLVVTAWPRLVKLGKPELGYEPATFWSPDTGFTPLGKDGFGQTIPLHISHDGQVIAGMLLTEREITAPWGKVAVRHAFRWTPGTGVVDLGVLGTENDVSSGPLKISADGSVILGSQRGQDESSSGYWIWTANQGLRNLKDALKAAGIDLAHLEPWWVNDMSADAGTFVLEKETDRTLYILHVGDLFRTGGRTENGKR